MRCFDNFSWKKPGKLYNNFLLGRCFFTWHFVSLNIQCPEHLVRSLWWESSRSLYIYVSTIISTLMAPPISKHSTEFLFSRWLLWTWSKVVESCLFFFNEITCVLVLPFVLFFSVMHNLKVWGLWGLIQGNREGTGSDDWMRCLRWTTAELNALATWPPPELLFEWNIEDGYKLTDLKLSKEKNVLVSISTLLVC